MTPHLHDRFVPGCYRCDLNRDEFPGEWRFVIRWSSDDRLWFVDDTRFDAEAATFPTLLEAETYVIERETRAER